ncbi:MULTISPECIES: hypothetical protein [Xanthomonas]|uniref:hypothetical protein n=1 Tax=Xanthomonas TaxID=338 RepID=UPI0004A7B0F0|nr:MULTISPECIES: hypothetical protein [Xanthomonas]MEA9660694.1 hypothetical protein [Xanthomonas campestris pv. raphani]QDS19381.1 hypothetical protein FPL05_06065 [Xanthomonas citri pv. glycines]QTK40153.1 hypothetical protein XcgCFBP7119R_05555 [Xanthomonas citri pv. glycines]
MSLKHFVAFLVIIAATGCTKHPPQEAPKGLLVTVDKDQIIVASDDFICQGATKAHPGADGLKDAVTGWVECTPKDTSSAPQGPPDGA